MTGQQFNLRWNNHTNNLVQVFADQLEREQMVDVTLSCQGKFIKAHRMVLGACSPYFQDIFDRHDSHHHPIIIMNGFEFEDIQAVVEFMYKGEVMVSESVMSRLLKAAECLQIKGLSNVRSKRDQQSGSQGQGESLEEDEDDEDLNKTEDPSSTSSSLSLQLPLSLNTRSTRRGSDNNQNGTNGVPLHKKRKRARAGSHTNDSKKASKTPSPNPKMLNDESKGGEEQGDEGDDVLTAINIEPPLLRDIDGTTKTEWDSPLKDFSDLNSSSPSEKERASSVVVPHHEVIAEQTNEKIPRPPNSFMIFANEWRRQLAGQFPNESNKEISVRLGLMWKDLSDDVKTKYFTAAKQANDDHKKKFPNYHYNPKEARLRKLWKIQQQQMGHMVAASGHQ